MVHTDLSRLRASLDEAPRPAPPPDTRLAGVLLPLIAGGLGDSSSERERASGSPPGAAGGLGGSSSERERASGSPSVLFTRRTEHLSRHAGEISFPGGLQHDEDADLRQTALRESREELGLDPSLVDVLGALSPVHTFVSAILIVPFVGVLPERPPLAPSSAEIDEVLEFPLADLAVAEGEVEFPRDGHVYRGYAYEMPGATIWGATARILHELLDLLRRS